MDLTVVVAGKAFKQFGDGTLGAVPAVHER
jgi:hypothetical protein